MARTAGLLGMQLDHVRLFVAILAGKRRLMACILRSERGTDVVNLTSGTQVSHARSSFATWCHISGQ